MTKDWVHRVGPSPVCQILLHIVMRAVSDYILSTCFDYLLITLIFKKITQNVYFDGIKTQKKMYKHKLYKATSTMYHWYIVYFSPVMFYHKVVCAHHVIIRSNVIIIV